MTLRLYDESEVRRALIRACVEAGGDLAFARRHGISARVVTLVRNGEGVMTARLCRALGFMRVSRFVRLQQASRDAGRVD